MSLTQSLSAAFVVLAIAMLVLSGISNMEAMQTCTASAEVCAYTMR